MRKLRHILITSLGLYLFTLIFTVSSDMDQDLGRHIKIGKIILQSRTIPETNLFSFTNAAFPFSNHHWLSEVIFYLANSSVSVQGLVYLKVFCILAAIGFVFYAAVRASRSVLIPTLVTFIFSPILLERSHIRPEMFGYVFFAIILYLFLRNETNLKRLLLLIPIMAIWANTHITFVFGLTLIGFWIVRILYESYREKKIDIKTKPILLILTGAILATLINPHGIYGALYPLFILQEYGYTIVENQNMFFLNQVVLNPVITATFYLAPIIIVAVLYLLIKKRILEGALLALFFSLALYQIRHIPFLFFTAVPTVSIAVSSMIPKKLRNIRSRLLGSMMLLCLIIVTTVVSAQSIYGHTFDSSGEFGGGVTESYRPLMEFVKKHKLPPHIFNNFDIGGYAIYALYPDYEVFVDNRPEAYPASFFLETYIPLQENPELRKQVFAQYDIHSVVISHTDQTPWATSFMNSIGSDPEWRLVYLDTAGAAFTDTTDFPDIRTDEAAIHKIIESSESYLDLLKYARAFALFNMDELSQIAFRKAASLNPNSCAVNRILIAQFAQNRPQDAERIQKAAWYCF